MILAIINDYKLIKISWYYIVDCNMSVEHTLEIK